MRAALLGIPLLITACAAAQTVEGSIINSVTGTGMASVPVFLTPVSGEAYYHALTDALGSFLFREVKAGDYVFGYQALHYSPSPVPFPTLHITADGKSVKVDGQLIPTPRISGHVLNDNGDGIPNARVEIIPQGSLAPVTTDATGAFELPLNEASGSYILSVVPPIGIKPPDPEPDSGRVLAWTRTFYPGVALLESASRIVVSSGDLSGIDMKLAAVPAHSIRGVLLNPDGTPAPKVAITLDEGPAPRWASQESGSPGHHVESNSDGVFEFPQVVDGEWRLAAEVENGGQDLHATQWIDLAGHAPEGVKLRLESPFTVRGQVEMETPKGISPPNPFPVFLVPHERSVRGDIERSNWMLWPVVHFEPALPRTPQFALIRKGMNEEMTANEFRESGSTIAVPGPDGNFNLENVYPGRYRIASTTPPPPYYMAAIRVGEAEVNSAEMEISSGAVPITVVYKSDGGSLRGAVKKCDSGMVLLIPGDPALQSLGFLRTARCDSSDAYEIPAVRPGNYYALAFTGNGGPPPLDEILLSQATKITIHANDAVSADLRAIPRN